MKKEYQELKKAKAAAEVEAVAAASMPGNEDNDEEAYEEAAAVPDTTAADLLTCALDGLTIGSSANGLTSLRGVPVPEVLVCLQMLVSADVVTALHFQHIAFEVFHHAVWTLSCAEIWTVRSLGAKNVDKEPLQNCATSTDANEWLGVLLQGKHTRFVDSEVADGGDGRSDDTCSQGVISPSKAILRGLPTAAGSHVRFDD